MNDESDLVGTKILRLFPLPGVVFFPHTVLPLHIFEPRYRQMTADALEDDGLIVVVMTRQTERPQPAGTLPELEQFACVGRIFKHKKLSDGRYNLLLVGLKRVRLIAEIPTDRLYRLAESEVVEEADSNDDSSVKEEVVDAFRAFMQVSGGIDPELDVILSGDISLGIVTDILAHTLSLAPSYKQMLLNEARARRRGQILLDHLRGIPPLQVEPGKTSRGFPPTFSAN